MVRADESVPKHSFLPVTLLFLVAGVAFAVAARASLRSVGLDEDAAILIRYAIHLARGFGFSWNPGEGPMDGATDFLYTIGVAGILHLGVHPIRAAQWLSGLGHIATTVFVFQSLRLFTRRTEIILFGSLFVALGIGQVYLAMGYGTPFFSAIVAMTWWLALRTIFLESNPQNAMWFAASAFLLGLARPDGVLLAFFMLFTVLVSKGKAQGREDLKYFLLFYTLLGVPFLAWRFYYFGHVLPLPFYRKVSRSGFYFSSLVASLSYVVKFTGPCLILWAFTLRRSLKNQRSLASLIPVLGYAGIWAVLSNAQNIAGRFQYALLPVAITACLFPIRDRLIRASAPKRERLRSMVAFLVSVLLSIGYWTLFCGQEMKVFENPKWTWHEATGAMLYPYRDQDYLLASTEAGLIPLYSEWRTLDLWGLNNWEITKNGGISFAILERHRPEVIFLEQLLSGNLPESEMHTSWCSMLSTVKQFAREKHYILAGLFPVGASGAHFFFVRDDFKDSKNLIEQIRGLNHGRKNLADDQAVIRYFDACSLD